MRAGRRNSVQVECRTLTPEDGGSSPLAGTARIRTPASGSLSLPEGTTDGTVTSCHTGPDLRLGQKFLHWEWRARAGPAGSGSSARYLSSDVGGTYRALVKLTGGPSGGSPLHLIRHDADASLCGIPGAQLSASGIFDEIVCSECIEWLPKRMDLSQAHPKIRRT